MKKRVLIADDDSSVRESLKKVLEASGYEVLSAEDGGEAVERITNDSVDLLLLDLEMPRMDGWDVFEGVRARCSSLPVIIITGLASELETKLVPGLDELFEKPIEVLPLLKKIEELLSEDPKNREARLETQLWSERQDVARPGYLTLMEPDWPPNS